MDLLKRMLGAFAPTVQTEEAAQGDAIRPAPSEKDPLAELWGKRIAHAREHWKKFHQRVRHNRATVAGFNWKADPRSKEFYALRANLIHGSITAMLPHIYARNPEIGASAIHQGQQLKLFTKTLEKVTNTYLDKAHLKARAKSTVRAALTTSIGVVKVMYQRDIKTDPIIQARIEDTQDNIQTIEGLLAEIADPVQAKDLEAKRAELDQLLRSLREQVEVTASEGLVIDRILTDNLLVDPSVVEFDDYRDADWIAQIIPMKKGEAERTYKVKLDGAREFYDARNLGAGEKDGRIASGLKPASDDDRQIAIVEIWDKSTMTVYTMAEGCTFWLRRPFSPKKVGQRFYPFFLLPYQLVDGHFVGPSMVDLTEKLQDEHNEARERFNKHRDLAIPGWVAAGDTSEKAIQNFTRSVSLEGFGEVAVIDTDGKPLGQVIAPKQHPPIDPAVYDTSAVRMDWEQVTGLQDAMRSTVVKAKTATEASIMQQSLSGRTGEFRDQVEDFLQEISQYAAQILLMELTPAQVERIMGPPRIEQVSGPLGSMAVEVPSYDWPTLTREQVFDLVELKIRAGSTGSPDKAEEREAWAQVLPVIQGLVKEIMQARAMGADAAPFENLLRETIRRFDERLEVERFLPQAAAPMPPAQHPPGIAPAAAQPPVAADPANPDALPDNPRVPIPQL